jgi:hypothetical protein
LLVAITKENIVKKTILFSLLLLYVLLFSTQMANAKAPDAGCPQSPKFYATGTSYGINPISGVIIDSVTTTGTQKNIVVLGQDPEEEGVGVTVALHSVEGDMVHNEWVWSCDYYGTTRDINRIGRECTPYPGAKGFYYEERHCKPVRTPGASRDIFDVRVWLQPSFETSSWLGWEQNRLGGKATLRYLYPEKWVAGTWTKDGFTVTGTPDLSWSTDYYEEWVKQLQGYNFLAGDTAAIDSLWSVTMVEVSNPIGGGSQSLGIFGYFNLSANTYPLPREIIGGNQWRVNYGELNLYTKLHRATCDPNSSDYLPVGTKNLTIEMKHIPMDLPGKWLIGIQVEMAQATVQNPYAPPPNNTLVEEWNYDDVVHWFSSGDFPYEMTEDGHYFYSYVLLSTPCNPMELDNCIDNSY